MFVGYPIVLVVILLQRGAIAESSSQQSKQAQGSNISDERDSLSSIASIFSPRMDFDQWKPLTGRGDPLRNDPTYDYEPPMLEKVHYWADDSRLEREHYPEKKSEVLMLGVSSRKPSVSSRPPTPPKRNHSPPPSKYEDYAYKFNEYYPMTILVPPPLPPSGYKPSLFIPPENKFIRPTLPTYVESTFPSRYTVSTPELITSFALQEANLIYEATDSNQTWFADFNKTQTLRSETVSSDYAGWGPTTPFSNENTHNDFSNLIPHREFIGDILTQSKYFNTSPSKIQEYMEKTTQPPTTVIPSFLPTALPPAKSTMSDTKETWPYYDQAIPEATTESSTETTTESDTSTVRSQTSAVDMFGGMISMPMTTDPERLEDNLYAHASENIQIYKDHATEDIHKLEDMQTMQPPPPVPYPTATVPTDKHSYQVNPHVLNVLLNDHQSPPTHDPYLHMRFTTPLTTTLEPTHEKPLTDSIPMYLIIQGHSKVKTYGSKPKPTSNSITDAEISKQHETHEVKHLHPLKEKYLKKTETKENNRESRSQNLTSLIEAGVGSIEIHEADVGIKYDVSDGSKVPVEIYRKGFVENDENNYFLSKKNYIKRAKRQIELNDLIPFDEDTIEELVYNFFETRKNDTGLTGFIAKAITDDVQTAVKDALTEDNEIHSKDKR